MATDTERRLEALEKLLYFGGGVTAGTASGRQLAAQAQLARLLALRVELHGL